MESKEDTKLTFDTLYQLSEFTENEYDQLKQFYLSKGQSTKLIKKLMSRSKIAILRNMIPPSGEIYAPVTFTSNYIIKYIQKDSWGINNSLEQEQDTVNVTVPESDTKQEQDMAMDRVTEAAEETKQGQDMAMDRVTEAVRETEPDHRYIVTITLWDLLVIDIDELDRLPFIKKRIDRYYPNELFYIHRTTRGYHLYLVSRKANHISGYAIYMRLKLGTDVAHGSNSLYTGSSIRLTRKKTEPRGHKISTYLEQYGGGEADREAILIYQDVVKWLKHFTDLDTDTGVLEHSHLAKLWLDTPEDFGKTHVRAAAPYTFKSNGMYMPNIGQSAYTTPVAPMLRNEWSRFIKHLTISDKNLYPLLISVQRQMGYDNLYRIFKANRDRAVGVHVQHNVHFVSYRDLLFVDYDHKSRLAIVARFARNNPGYIFRIVTTNKGYHAFLTSHPMPHDDYKSLDFLMSLYSDPAHILGVFHRGYSVRINQKRTNEKPYREVIKYGIGPEDPRLYALYLEHLDLYNQSCKNKVLTCQYQIKRSKQIYKDEGVLKIY